MRVAPFSYRSLGDTEGSQGGYTGLPVIPPAPSYSEEDLQLSDNNGFVRGYNEGMTAGIAQMQSEQRELENGLQAAIQMVVRRVEEIAVQHQDFLAQQAELTGKLALSIARKVAGRALGTAPEQEIEALAADCMRIFAGQKNFTVYVNSRLMVPMEERLVKLIAAKGLKKEVRVVGDANIPLTDCRVEWHGGAAARNTGDLWKDIENIIEKRTTVEVQSIPAGPNALGNAIEEPVLEQNEAPEGPTL